MHEMSVCQNILDIVLEQAGANDFTHVERIVVEIGPFSGVEVEALRFGFDVFTRGTIAEGARLDIFETQAIARCMDCHSTVFITQRFDACPHCGAARLKVTGGEELRIKELEVT